MSSATIDSFRGEYLFLSNFFIESNGLSNEHHFQAAKTQDVEAQTLILRATTPKEAKRLAQAKGMQELSAKLGREISLREDWDEVRLEVMRDLLKRKFSDPTLRQKLLQTKNANLIEGNFWHDTFWGVCNCSRHLGQGDNHLGELLMQLRGILDN